MTALVLFRAAGWLDSPDGESRESTIALIRELVAEHTRLAATLSKPAHEREPPHCSTCSCGMEKP